MIITEKEHYFLAGHSGYSRSGHDSAILPARVANHSVGFGSSSPAPLTELAIQIILYGNTPHLGFSGH